MVSELKMGEIDFINVPEHITSKLKLPKGHNIIVNSDIVFDILSRDDITRDQLDDLAPTHFIVKTGDEYEVHPLSGVTKERVLERRVYEFFLYGIPILGYDEDTGNMTVRKLSENVIGYIIKAMPHEVTINDIQEILNISRSTIYKYRSKFEDQYPFPEQVGVRGRSKLYSLKEVKKWFTKMGFKGE